MRRSTHNSTPSTRPTDGSTPRVEETLPRRATRRAAGFLETNREQIADLEDEIDRVEDQIAQKEAEQESETSDLTDEIESTRIELHSVQTDIERLESTIDDLEAARQDRERNRERIESLRDEIRTLTERIENLEQRLQTQFNEAMDELIELLEYEAIERVWLDGNFDLIVAREENGVTRQDTIYNLSESEREMGLVLALAGYIAYDVADTVPVLVIDTLGAFDAERATGCSSTLPTSHRFWLPPCSPTTRLYSPARNWNTVPSIRNSSRRRNTVNASNPHSSRSQSVRFLVGKR
ncbi:hypothetical protein D8S78_23410 [Natrialba swarupiae]|nr:hypothetical protein [Natrialba swarupiae]